MRLVTVTEFRNQLSNVIGVVQSEPVEITTREMVRRAVVVLPEFYDRAIRVLEDQADVGAVAAARTEVERVSHKDLIRELGF